MSKLAELLHSRGVLSATPATPATHQATGSIAFAESSKSSESSRPPLPKLIFSPDLERRIRSMARRWECTAEELQDALARARANPASAALAVALDERREQEFREKGFLPKVDA
jgi:hypothetical protein